MSHEILYNTQQEELVISEYGRIVQEYLHHISAIEDKAKRTELTKALVAIIAHLNPDLKQQEGYEQIIWDHLHIISKYSLDVDAPYPIPEEQAVNSKPDALGYANSRIRFRFYGRNLQLMVEKAVEMEEGEDKVKFLNSIASFMFNSSRNWNNENLSNEVLAEHLSTLSRGKLQVDPESLEVTQEAVYRRPSNPSRRGKNTGRRNYSKNRPRR